MVVIRFLNLEGPLEIIIKRNPAVFETSSEVVLWGMGFKVKKPLLVSWWQKYNYCCILCPHQCDDLFSGHCMMLAAWADESTNRRLMERDSSKSAVHDYKFNYRVLKEHAFGLFHELSHRFLIRSPWVIWLLNSNGGNLSCVLQNSCSILDYTLDFGRALKISYFFGQGPLI